MPKSTPTTYTAQTLRAKSASQGKSAANLYARQHTYRNSGVTKKNIVFTTIPRYVPRR